MFKLNHLFFVFFLLSQTAISQSLSLTDLAALRLKTIGKVQEELQRHGFTLSKTTTADFDDIETAFFTHNTENITVAHIGTKRPKNNSVYIEFTDPVLYGKYEFALKDSDFFSAGSSHQGKGIDKVYINKLTKEEVIISIYTKASQTTDQASTTYYRMLFQRKNSLLGL